jgi:hypothetical protein
MINIYKFQDINTNDINLRTQYYNYFLNGQIDEANQLILNNTQLNSKVLNANTLNSLVNGVLGLEQLYYTNVDNYLANLNTNFNLNINDLIFVNTYDSTLQYVINNFVLYDDELYYCKAEPTIGTSPTDTNYWLYLGLKGSNGRNPLGVNYVGIWNTTTTYNQYDMALYANKLYVSKQTNTNQVPTNNTYWLYAIGTTNQGIFVSDTEPTNIVIGQIWLQTNIY